MSLSGVTAEIQDTAWLKSAEVTQTVLQGFPGSIFAYWMQQFNISIGQKFGGLTAFASTAGNDVIALSPLNTSPATTIDLSPLIALGYSYVENDAIPQNNPLLGSGDEEITVVHIDPLVPIVFGGSVTPLSSWPDNLTAAIKEAWVLVSAVPHEERVYDLQTSKFWKYLQVTITLSRKFVSLTNWSPVALSGQWTLIFPSPLYSRDGLAVTISTAFVPGGSHIYINKDCVSIQDTFTGLGEQLVEMIYYAPVVPA